LRIAHYFDQGDVNADDDPERVVLDADNVYDEDVRKGRVRLSLDAIMHIFDSTVDQEDYAMGERPPNALRKVARYSTLSSAETKPRCIIFTIPSGQR
jgi:hypothetical protein